MNRKTIISPAKKRNSTVCDEKSEVSAIIATTALPIDVVSNQTAVNTLMISKNLKIEHSYNLFIDSGAWE